MIYEEIYHHGILGQKWGIRRYQNKDGSLTSEGKKRLRTNMEIEYRKQGKGAIASKLKARRDTSYYNSYSKTEERAIAKRNKIEEKLKVTKEGTRKAERLGKKWVNKRWSELYADSLQKNIMNDSDAVDKFVKRYALGSVIDGGFGIVGSYLESRDSNSFSWKTRDYSDRARLQAKDEYKEKYGKH